MIRVHSESLACRLHYTRECHAGAFVITRESLNWPSHSFVNLRLSAAVHLTTKLMYIMTAYMYYTPNSGFTANDASFYKNKVG